MNRQGRDRPAGSSRHRGGQAYSAALIDSSRRLLRVQEQERSRISRELHDGINQTLLGASLYLNNPALQSVSGVADARRLIGEAIAEIKRISYALSPSVLEDFGFSAAVERMVQDTRQSAGLSVSCAMGDFTETLGRHTQLNLYRIIQEALGNIARHATAKSASVTLVEKDAGVFLEIRDDGVGMASRISPGHGLRNIRERAVVLGGRCRVLSRPGRGTSVQIWVPDAAADEAGRR